MAFKTFPEEHCVIDQRVIPADRLRKRSVTCSAECEKTHRNNHYRIRTLLECAFCGRPASQAERAAYRRFRNFEAHFPHLLYPRQYKAFAEAGGTLDEFIKAVQADDELIPRDNRKNEVKTLHEEVDADAIRNAQA